MNRNKMTTTTRVFSAVLGAAALAASTAGWTADVLLSPTRDGGGELPPAEVEPIHTQFVFEGYICEMNVGQTNTAEIRLGMKTQPFCQGSTAGFAAVCFSANGIGHTCPNENNPSRVAHIYKPELKPALMAMLQQSMLRGQRIGIWRLSNTMDYPHYEGPQLYGNWLVFQADGMP